MLEPVPPPRPAATHQDFGALGVRPDGRADRLRVLAKTLAGVSRIAPRPVVALESDEEVPLLGQRDPAGPERRQIGAGRVERESGAAASLELGGQVAAGLAQAHRRDAERTTRRAHADLPALRAAVLRSSSAAAARCSRAGLPPLSR